MVCGPKVVSRSVPNASEQEQDATAAEKSRGIAHKFIKAFESDTVYLPFPIYHLPIHRTHFVYGAG